MIRPRRILYAGDGPSDGAARYLLAILHASGVQTRHIPPDQVISMKDLRPPFDAYIFSDYSKRNLRAECENKICHDVKMGAGLMMVGGWGSFSGPFGGWRRSRIESLLPVQCLNRDDRIQFPSGAWVSPSRKHEITRSLPWNHPPMICGLNQVRVRHTGRTVLSARPLVRSGASAAKLLKPHPLLVLGTNPSHRSAVFLSDFAPHWSGGLIDWGPRTILRTRQFGEVQIGRHYLQLGVSIIRWLLS